LDFGDNAIPFAETKEGSKLLKTDGALAMINLQATPHDAEARVKLRGKCDEGTKKNYYYYYL
jgi:hypothetical protein